MLAVSTSARAGCRRPATCSEYTNHPGGTYWSDRRIANGAQDPFNIKLWCLWQRGYDGPWQVGQKTAYEYGRLANETGKAMRLIDSGVELVACGSSNSRMPTFGSWESTVLEQCYETVDYVSPLHSYYEELDGDPLELPGVGYGPGQLHRGGHRDQRCGRCQDQESEAPQPSASTSGMSVYASRFSSDRAQTKDPPWLPHPRIIEDDYTITDAVVVGTLLNSLLRHGDRVTCGLPGSADQCHRTAAAPSQAATPEADDRLPVRTDAPPGPWPDSPGDRSCRSLRLGSATADVPLVDASATYDDETGRTGLFVANRSLTEAGFAFGRRARGSSEARTGFPHLARAAGQDRHSSNGVSHDAVTPRAVRCTHFQPTAD